MNAPTHAEKILAAVDEGFDEQVRFLSDLVSMPSLRGAEGTAQDFMAAAMHVRGLSVDRWKIDVEDIRHMPGFSPVMVSYDNAWNVVGTHRPRAINGKSLILNGHIDVVPVGPLEMWHSPPFKPRIDDGWMYGRGSGDMKAGLVANLFALDALARANLAPAAPVYLQSVVEEECTGNGALACLQRGYRAHAAIIPEPMGEHLLTAQVGVMWFQVKVMGRPAHVALASTGANAIESCFPLVRALHELEHRWNEDRHPSFANHVHPINFVLARIEGGDWTSSVPAWCTFDMRVSMYPGTTVAQVKSEIEATIAAAAAQDSFLATHPPQLVYHGFEAEGYVLEPGTEAQNMLEACHAVVAGQPLPHVSSTGTTDARVLGLYGGIPSMVYGPWAENIHAFDERVSLESMRRVTKTIALFVAQWCGTEARNA